MIDMESMKDWYGFRLKRRSLLFNYYAYFDDTNYRADQLFIDHKVRVFFGDEFRHAFSNYCIIFCKVFKKDSEEFEKALSELPKKMLLCGHNDFVEYCESAVNAMREEALMLHYHKN